jgi:hypothetical protein
MFLKENVYMYKSIYICIYMYVHMYLHCIYMYINIHIHTVEKSRSRFEALTRGGDDDKPQSYYMIIYTYKYLSIYIRIHL